MLSAQVHTVFKLLIKVFLVPDLYFRMMPEMLKLDFNMSPFAFASRNFTFY